MAQNKTSAIDSILVIVRLGVTLLGEAVKGNPTNLEQALLDMTQHAVSAYEAQTGQPIDPTLLHSIDPVT